jgi:hypothetical protein
VPLRKEPNPSPGPVERTLPISGAAISPRNLRNAEPGGDTLVYRALLSATAAEVRIRASLFADIGFRYALAFCVSSDSGAQ